MDGYITTPLDTDARTISDEVIAAIQGRFPEWTPAEANLETIIIDTFAQAIADARDVASLIGAEIFRAWGLHVAGVAPIEATRATATTTWTLTDTLGHTITAGTIVQMMDGDTAVPFATTTDTVIAPGSSTATGVTIQAVDTGSAANNLAGTISLVDSLAFVSTITIASGTTAGGSDGETDAAYLDRLREEVTLISPRPVLPDDYAILARRVPGVHRALAIDGYNPHHNRLTANQSSIETNTTGLNVDANATIARTTTTSADGVAALRVTASAAGDASAKTDVGVNGIPVQAGASYTALASFRPNSAARNCHTDIIWYTAAGAVISTSSGTAASCPSGTYTQRTVTATAPANAAFAAVRVAFAGSAAADICDVDKLALHEGDSTTWALGQSDGTNTQRCICIAALDENGDPVSASVRTAIQTYLDGLREVNFQVATTPPTVTQITVTFTALTYPGFDTADVAARAEDAVNTFLKPATWGAPNAGDTDTWILEKTVRYFDVAHIISQVEGIRTVTALTIQGASSDYTLPGVAPVPTGFSVTGTVTL